MDQKLEDKLMRKYPKIFRQKDLPMTETCMCWGLSCDNGWYDIIDKLCEKIQKYVDENNIEQVEAMQVKEKFGGLRFYVCGAPDKVYNYINDAENESLETCESCGTKENVKCRGNAWVVTLCDKCEEKRNEKR